MRIRPAVCADAPRIAAIHVETWRTTYRGIMPDSLLDGLSVANRERLWTRWLCGGIDAPPGVFAYVAETEVGTIVGFAGGGPGAGANPEYSGELSMIYILEQHQRVGIGKALMRAVAEHFAQNGTTSMRLWVAAENKAARKFYELLGGQQLHSKHVDFGGESVEEIAYGWSDTRALANAALSS